MPKGAATHPAAAATSSTSATAPSAALPQPGTACPYMHTINREALDFDFEKVCSVSLESHNVYACLVCGKYFQGRGPASHAFAHALDASHHIFLNLQTEAAYSLPDNNRIADPLLDQIAFALRPKFTPAAVAALDTAPHSYRTLNGDRHLQGVTALDNLHASDYANVVFQSLLTVAPLRDYLLLAPHDLSATAVAVKGASSPQARVLDELCALAQKVWSPAAFRGHISPHEVMQEVASASAHRFGPLVQSDPADFFAWIVHLLHREVGKSVKRDKAAGRAVPGRANKTLVKECFQGSLEVTTFRDSPGERNSGAGGRGRAATSSPFWLLSLDLPPKPLFKDASERTLVAQVPLRDLLRKYDGESQHHVVSTGERLSYRLTKLPPYLVLTIKRVTETKFAAEKNPAVVHCPLNDLDMSEFCPATGRGSCPPQLYGLIAIVIHDGPHDKGTYRVATRHAATAKWFSIQNVTVSEVMPQLVSLGETCLLLYARDSVLATSGK
jgi:U4/U6.U5 tri-snRNP-associated protein 2